uniref:Uncharacterized protein n=1 Tax=Populus trichocarpa TaxID=3694 RepID=A0A2K1YH20_POPTR
MFVWDANLCPNLMGFFFSLSCSTFYCFMGLDQKLKAGSLRFFFFFLRRISFTIFLNKNEFCRPHISSNKNSAKLRIPSIFGILYTTPRDCPWDLPIIILASRQTLEIVI